MVIFLPGMLYPLFFKAAAILSAFLDGIIGQTHQVMNSFINIHFNGGVVASTQNTALQNFN
jgi:hypothetical protein